MRLIAVIVAALMLAPAAPRQPSGVQFALPRAHQHQRRTVAAGGTRLHQTGERRATAGLHRPAHDSTSSIRLQTAYQQALARHRGGPRRADGRPNSWATARDGCTQNADVHTCLVEAYQTRLVQLAIADPTTVAPPVITYHCPADSGPLTAQFYNQFDPPNGGARLERQPGDPVHLTVRQRCQIRPARLRILGASGRSQT